MLTPESTTCKASALLLAALLAGCAGKTETQSFVATQGSSVETSQIAVGADFSRYRTLHAVDMGIFSPEHAVTPAADLDRIREIFRGAFLAELEGYEVVTEPAPDAMTVAASLIDFRNATYQDTMSVRSDLRAMASPGKMIFTMELRDSESDRVLARAADSAKTPAIADEEGETTDWAGVEEAAQHWAGLFRAFLDQNFPH